MTTHTGNHTPLKRITLASLYAVPVATALAVCEAENAQTCINEALARSQTCHNSCTGTGPVLHACEQNCLAVLLEEICGCKAYYGCGSACDC